MSDDNQEESFQFSSSSIDNEKEMKSNLPENEDDTFDFDDEYLPVYKRKIRYPERRAFVGEEDTVYTLDSLNRYDKDDGVVDSDDNTDSLFNRFIGGTGSLFSSSENYHEPRFMQSQIQRQSESSLSSPSTPEPLKGKLCLNLGGQVGLNNLGNTCYLNSTLQCLTAAHELSFKLSEDYNNEILGLLENGDKLIFLQVTCRLFSEMWLTGGKGTSMRRSVTPNQFKNVLGRIDSRFSGYRQEDSQEALSIILDKLHEDLKALEKLKELNSDAENTFMISNVEDSDGWLTYCKKEDSIIRKLFHGQLKSTIKCKKCEFKSETFDPFNILNLPIPTASDIDSDDVSVSKADYNRHSDNNNRYDRLDSIYNNNYDNANSYNLGATRTLGKFKMFCFNDRIVSDETAFLIMRREFKGLNDFRMFYRGFGFWIVELRGSEIISVTSSKLPSVEDLYNESGEKTFISYPADLLQQNYLVTFMAANSGETVGFPVLLREAIEYGNNNVMTPTKFIELFLKGLIRSILKKRFTNRLEFFDSAVSLMLSSANEYFKVEVIKSDHYLTQVKVIILNDKSDFNDLIFFKEIDDPNDLFEDLCVDLCVEEDTNCRIESDGDIYDVRCDVDTTYNAADTTSSADIANVSLFDCFDRLLSVEKLTEWKCEGCQVVGCGEKKLELWRLPNLMILHLKRFSYGSSSGYYSMMSYGSGGGGSKINSSIDFPLDLDMTDIMGHASPKDSFKYELFAISQHSGSLNYGHYTAIVKHESSGKWLLMDDSSVKVYESVEEWMDFRVKELAYVLFYRKINK